MWCDADRALSAAAAQCLGIATVAMARQCGLTDEQIDARSASVWTRLYPGVWRLPGVPETWEGNALAAVLAGGAGAALSHRSAAVVYGAPGRRTDMLEIACPRWERARHPGLIVHEQRRLDERDRTVVDTIPIVTPELMLLQLAWWKPVPNYLEAVIHALRRRRFISYESANATFVRHARRGLKGVRALRVALERWNPDNAPTESEMETLLLQTLRAHNLPEPVLQFEVLDERGMFVARTDAALPSWKITLEYQSNQEHLDEFQVAADDRRRNRIIAAGFFPLVARYDDLRSGGGELVDEIRAVMRRTA
jgi:hypothetical protein